ncbi:MAG: hypothetical protein KDD33_07940 [Bdellovibrionales bacterium]|nr:hypothetical protein [Bdellovibrionales bacterium]
MRVTLVILFSILSFQSHAANDFLSLFKNKKPMIAALMVERDLSTEEKRQKAIQWCKEQITIAEKAGMEGILFEFRGGKILEPKINEQKFKNMLEVSRAFVSAAKNIVVGVEILWHYPQETLRLAHESGAKFVRVDFFSDEVIADDKKVPLDPKGLLAYRKKIGADKVVLLTDIQVKYSKMVDPKMGLDQSAKKARGLGSDGLIVTSTKSGKAPDPVRPQTARKGAGALPIVVGSGFSYKNAESLLPYVDAVIVGTSISVKTGGPLVPEKVNQLMTKVRQFRKAKAL